MSKLRIALLLIALTLVAALPCLATPITVGSATNLLSLINTNGSITVGDKVFSGFTGSFATSTGFVSPTSLASITVQGIQDGDLLGIRFSGGFSAVSYGATQSSLDILLGYTVTAPSATITDLHLAFNGGVTGLASTSVTETFTDGSFPTQVLVVTNPPPVLDASVDLPHAVQSLFVMKDIQLNAGSPNISISTGNASISYIDQLYSQVAVPEPSSLLLLGSGLVGLGIWFRKRS